MAESLCGQVLIATPSLSDPNFEKAVVLVFVHSDHGAVGLVINRPLDDVTHARVFEAIELGQPKEPERKALRGGPVSPDSGWVIHTAGFKDDDTVEIADGIFVSASLEVLRRIAAGEGPERYLLCLGYSGWGPEQLENEIEQYAWLTCAPTAELLFDLPYEKRWRGAYRILGIEPNQVIPVGTGGNA